MMLDLRGLCSFADFFVICNGDTNRHIEAVWRGIVDEMKKNGVVSHHNEGTPDSGWVLVDFGSVVVHIFTSAERDYYQLDEFWGKATPVLRIQ